MSRHKTTVILNKDVPKVGRKFEVKKLAPGFVRNWLLPKNLAQLADDRTITEAEKQRQSLIEEKQKKLAAVENLKEKLDQVNVIIKVAASEAGHLFAGLKEEDIANALAEQFDIHLEPDWIDLERPIKEVGEVKIPVVMGDQKDKPEIKVTIEAL
ncbi:MAG: 50S ribosomal protein L9 [Patescibacteria group bacterium]